MNDWRPFEPSRDEVQRIKRDREMNTCNLHDDCAAADAVVRERGGRRAPFTARTVLTAMHCSDAECEDCFGS